MKKHVVLTTATATAAATTGTAATAVTGDSLTQRNYGTKGMIQAVWQTQNTNAGFGQITFPTGHDTTRGWRAGCPAADTQLLTALGDQIATIPQEVLSVTLAGNAVAGDVEQMSFLTSYDVDKGQTWLTWAEVERRAKKVTTIEASITSAAGPGYSGTELITADSDLLIANKDYAILGFTSRTRVHLIGWQGPDFGNERIACPGLQRYEVGAQWFKLLSAALGEPYIPVFNSGNKGATNWFVHTDENAGTFVCTARLVLLD